VWQHSPPVVSRKRAVEQRKAVIDFEELRPRGEERKYYALPSFIVTYNCGACEWQAELPAPPACVVTLEPFRYRSYFLLVILLRS